MDESGRTGTTGEATGESSTGELSADEIARLAHDLFDEDPQRARALADRARTSARARGDLRLEAISEQASGLAARELLEIPASIDHFRRAIARADQAGDAALVAQIRLSLCVSLSYAGEHRAALAEADLAAPGLRGLDAAKLRLQRSGVEERLGRFDAALADLDAACRTFQRRGDQLWHARARNNRGILRAQLGSIGPARRDLLAARDLFAGLGLESAAILATNNLGWVAGLEGDIPRALADYDEAEEGWRRLHVPLTITFGDRCNTFLQARLVTEARAEADQAVVEFEAGGMVADAAEVRLLSATAALLDGDAETARATALAARRSFRAQRRPTWAARADLLVGQAEARAGRSRRATLAATRRAARTLAAAGFEVEALDARLVAARLSLALGDEVRDEDVPLADRALARAPVAVQVRAHETAARHRLAAGDEAGARREVRAGLRVVDRSREALGATELRSAAAGHGQDLAALGLGLALASGRPAEVLDAAEQYRAAALWPRAVRPPADPRLGSALAELRALGPLIEQAAGEGEATDELRRRQHQVEDRIRRLTRQAVGVARRAGRQRATGPRGSSAASPSVDGRRSLLPAVRTALDGGTLVSFHELDGALGAVVVGSRRQHLVELGPVGPVAARLESLRFGLRRRARSGRRIGARRAADVSVEADAAALDALLLGPVREIAPSEPGRRVVVVPTNILHSVPWGLLPSLTGHPVTVAPSARLWLRAGHGKSRIADDRAGRSVIVAGPHLAHADAEARSVAALRPGSVVLLGAGAATDAVVAALDGARLGHLACHAEFRADNPLFSALQLADGPLTVYQLEQLHRPPAALVMSACDSGLSAVRPGDELMGLSASLLTAGTSVVVGSVVPVSDEHTARCMTLLHARWTAAGTPAGALAELAVEVGADDPGLRAALGSFVCFGAG